MKKVLLILAAILGLGLAPCLLRAGAESPPLRTQPGPQGERPPLGFYTEEQALEAASAAVDAALEIAIPEAVGEAVRAERARCRAEADGLRFELAKEKKRTRMIRAAIPWAIPILVGAAGAAFMAGLSLR